MRKFHLNQFLMKAKVCDEDGTLSLTSLMMMVLIVKLAIVPTLDLATVATLFLALANYNGKKLFAKLKHSKTVADQDKLKSLENEVRSLASAASFKNLGR